MLGWKDVSKYDFKVITLFEAIQLEWLFKWRKHEELSVLLNKYPEVSWFIKYKNPKIKGLVEQVEAMHSDLSYSRELEERFICSLEDWIVYVIDPNSYDQHSHNNWDPNELLGIIDFNGKTVIDIGSGTGKQTFIVAPLAESVYSVEPIGNLRTFISDKRDLLGYKNIFVVDGLMTKLPYPDAFADIVMSGHVFGDHFDLEFIEMSRVLKPGGMMILIPGNDDKDNDTHKYLVDKGFEFSVFLEPGDGYKRKYWLTK